MLRLLETGKIAPEKLIIHRLSLEELGRGFEMIRDKTENYCKVMCVQ